MCTIISIIKMDKEFQKYDFSPVSMFFLDANYSGKEYINKGEKICETVISAH